MKNENIKRKIIPAAQWNKYHPWPPKGGLRYLIHNAEKNGFKKVIRRVGKTVLLDEKAFFDWVDEQNEITNNS